MTAANRIAEIFDAPCEINDGPAPHPARGGRLELRDVGFRVPDAQGDRWLLRHVTLTVEPRQSTRTSSSPHSPTGTAPRSPIVA